MWYCKGTVPTVTTLVICTLEFNSLFLSRHSGGHFFRAAKICTMCGLILLKDYNKYIRSSAEATRALVFLSPEDPRASFSPLPIPHPIRKKKWKRPLRRKEIKLYNVYKYYEHLPGFSRVFVLDEERHCETEVSCRRTEQWSRSGLESGSLNLKPSWLTNLPPRLW